MEEMTTKKTWKEFRDSKLLWWTNRILHTFGWSIVLVVEDDGEISEAYPARVKFRGFDYKRESEGFEGLAEYLLGIAPELNNETKSSEVNKRGDSI